MADDAELMQFEASPEFAAALAELKAELERAAQPQRRMVSAPVRTLSGRETLRGARPMTVQEQTMLENPALQMGRDAGAFATRAIDAAGLGLPGIAMETMAPNALAAIRENEEFANPLVGGVGTLGGAAAAGGPLNALGRGAAAVGRSIAELPMWAKAAGVGIPVVATPSQAGPPEDAKAQEAMKRLIASDPALQSLEQQIKDLTTTSTAPPFNAKTGQGQPIKNRELAVQQLPAVREQFNKRIAEMTKGNLPFDKAHPDLASWWAAVQWGGPLAAAMLTRGAGNLAERLATTGPWNRAVTRAEKALDKGQESKAAFHAGKAQEFLNDEPGRIVGSVQDFTRETLLPTIAGGAVGMEAALFPHQYNRQNAPVGSEEREEAERRLAPENFWETAAPGLMAGTLGGFTGAHMPNITAGYRPAADTRNLTKWLNKAGDDASPPPVPLGSSGGTGGLPRPTGGAGAPPGTTARNALAGPETPPRQLPSPEGSPSQVENALGRPRLADRVRDTRPSGPEPSPSEPRPTYQGHPLPPGIELDVNGRPFDVRTGHKIRTRLFRGRDD